MKTRTLVLVSIVASTLAAAAYAGNNGRHGTRFFEKLDRNQDGQVTPTEMKLAAADRINAADTNGDGAVTPEEMKAHREQKRAQRKAERFAKKDANSDGVLSREEIARMPDKIFAKLDADGNGSLSADEFAAGRKGLHKGKGDKATHKRNGSKRKNAMLKRLDTNGDGKVGVAEAEAMAEVRFKRLDKNEDGVLTADEIKSRKRGKRGKRGRKNARASAE